MEIKIDYNGKYPNLCSGDLVVTIDDKKWNFPGDCMGSGGYFTVSGGYMDGGVIEGPWRICEWPKDFPENLKSSVVDKINETVEWGCCGGCI